ncbi:PRD domain-containing protein [Acididesulfobacillus acetoxydans]|nr:PRD domain-containing protein [Acididesulfobacillus acetoxydans]
MPDKYTVHKAFNNNVLWVTDGQQEKVLLGKGIGFGLRAGDAFQDGALIEKVFTLEDENRQKFSELITQVDAKTVGLCEEVIFMFSRELNEELDQKIHVSLTDHIAFALHRLRQHDEIVNPFLIETETLYPREYALALKAAAILEKGTAVRIPDGEIGFIALHIHSARNQGKLSNTIKYAFLANSICELVEDKLGLEIDKTSLDYARFVTHIRFTVERLLKGALIKNRLLKSIKREYKESYAIAKKVAVLLEETIGKKVVPDEVGYIAVHIEKLRDAERRVGGK